MEATKTTMKWKRPSQETSISSHHLHLHPNRSKFETHRKRPRSIAPTIEDSLVGNVLRNTPIKDLRVKRVYSPISDPPENGTHHHKLGVEVGSHEAGGGPKAAKNDGFENSANGFSESGLDMEESESKWSEKSSPDVNANGVCLNVDKVEAKVLKPRKRVFNAPGSFGYRRLLPYLKDMAKDNSSLLEFCEQPNRVKLLEGKPFQSMGASEIQAGCIRSIHEQKLSRECPTNRASTLSEAVQVSPHDTCNPNALSSDSLECVPISPSTAMVDECQSKRRADGQITNIDISVSCKAQKSKVPGPFFPLTMEDCQVNKEHVIDMYTPLDDVGTADNAGNIYCGEAANVKDQSSQNYENSNQSPDGGMRKIDTMHPCEDQIPNLIYGQRVGDPSKILNQIDDPNEESVQMTPPDAEISGKLEVQTKRILKAGHVVQSPDQGLGKKSTGFHHIDATTWVDVTPQQSSPKSKLVLKPCSRLKLFKSPGSLSYRRFLPFLLDMQKNNSGAMTDKDHSEHQISDPVTLPAPQLATANSSLKDSEQNIASLDNLAEFQMPFDLQKEQHVEQAVSGTQSELETSPDNLSLGHETDPAVTSSCPSTSEATSSNDDATLLANSLSRHPQVDCISSKAALSNGEKPIQADSLSQNSSQVDTTVSSGFHAALSNREKPIQADSLSQNSSQVGTTDSSGFHAVCPRKGIIKRNPRGCRGPCSCLNCASFRLHAERAFEFSRNQMLDAEQVALDLMKELSSLSKLLELSAAGANNPIINLNEVQEACRKASAAEGLARSRLCEMNYDLNIHCRVTCVHEPRVTFSDHIEEKVIPRTKFSSN